jgi:signal transduction histidine kinase
MDISDRKHDEEALLQSRAEAETRLAQLRATIDSLSEAVYVCDPEGRILLANPAFCRFSGTAGRADALTLRDLRADFEAFDLNGRSVPWAEWPVSKALRGETVRNRELCVRRVRQSDEVTVSCNAAPVRDAAGVVVMAVVSFEDITTAKLAEKALVQSEKLASVGRMAATIAHEINNPLAAAMNAIFLASSDIGVPTAAAANLELAENELGRVAHITKQTLGFYRETGNPSAVRLPDVLDGVLDLYAPKLRNKAVAVERTYGSVTPVHAIEGEMRQVVSNLIANSVDALAANGRLHIRTSNPSSVNGARPMVRLTIADNGSGIAPENLKRIFEPFFTTKQAIGTGLGLWVTRELVKKHDGRMRVRSRVGQGTVFSIWLPAERRQRDRNQAA